MNSKTLLISVFVLFVFISGTIYFTYSKEDNGLYYTIEKSDAEITLTAEEENVELLQTNSEITSVSSEIIVYLHGSVVNEGVYHVELGSRVYEALELAGGYNKDASRGFVNLARLLVDGESIYFPTPEEEMDLELKETIIVDDGLININSATLDQLVDLPGIGEAKARSIIAYRTMNGEFTQIEDIMNVSGIKESLFMTIKDMISV